MIIIKALVSLAFYYNSLRVEDRKQEVISILSIDKFDATLPPICSGKAFRLYEYSEKYKLSLQFTVYLYLNML